MRFLRVSETIQGLTMAGHVWDNGMTLIMRRRSPVLSLERSWGRCYDRGVPSKAGHMALSSSSGAHAKRYPVSLLVSHYPGRSCKACGTSRMINYTR